MAVVRSNRYIYEIWKALNIPKYPLIIKQQLQDHEGVPTRADKKVRLCEIGSLQPENLDVDVDVLVDADADTT